MAAAPRRGRPESALPDMLDRNPLRRALDRHIAVDDWAGAIPQERARVPSVRIGRRWFSSLWLIPIGLAGLIVAIALAQQLRQYDWMTDFIAT